MNVILGFLKNPKLIMAAFVVAILVSGGYYMSSLIKENGRLEEQLSNSMMQLRESRATLEQEREQFGKTINNYNELMSNYMGMLAESDQRSSRLEQTINRLARDNKELQQCFEMDVPEELLDEVFRRRGE